MTSPTNTTLALSPAAAARGAQTAAAMTSDKKIFAHLEVARLIFFTSNQYIIFCKLYNKIFPNRRLFRPAEKQ
jgi:hypothetical protein